MRTLKRVATPITADADGIALAQQTGGAAALTLNGVGVASGIAVLSPARRVRFASGGNIAARTFTVTGLDRSGSVITDTVTGVNNNTVATNKLFKAVTAVSVDGAVGSDVTVGWTVESVTGWLILPENKPWTLRAFFASGGTVNYDIEGTSQNILRDRLAGDHPDDLHVLQAAEAGNYTSNNETPMYAVRLKANASDVPVTLAVTI